MPAPITTPTIKLTASQSDNVATGPAAASLSSGNCVEVRGIRGAHGMHGTCRRGSAAIELSAECARRTVFADRDGVPHAPGPGEAFCPLDRLGCGRVSVRAGRARDLPRREQRLREQPPAVFDSCAVHLELGDALDLSAQLLERTRVPEPILVVTVGEGAIVRDGFEEGGELA